MPSKNPLVSVATVVLNGEQHLQHCIDSIRCQSYGNIEYIVIDGGSTDGTLDIIADNRDVISRWVSEPDRGISDAFNKAIAGSSGEIIGILNSDDSYTPQAVAAVVASHIASRSHPSVYYGKIRYFSGTEEYTLVPQLSKLWRYMSLFHPASFISRDLYDKHGTYRLDYRHAMDSELLHRFLAAGCRFEYVPDVLANFRLEGKSDREFAKSYREFYLSVRRHNPHSLARAYMYVGILRKCILRTKLGQAVKAQRKLLPFLFQGKNDAVHHDLR